MTSLAKDRRNLRPNRMKRWGKCKHCGGDIRIWFAVDICNLCLGETTEAFEDTRKERPSLVRYYR